MNMKTIGVFLLGAAVGMAASWKFAQKKWQTYADEDIQSVKNAYAKKIDELKLQGIQKEKADFQQDMMKKMKHEAEHSSKDITEQIKEQALQKLAPVPVTNYNEKYDGAKKEIKDIPYVIQDDLFGSEDYVVISLRLDIALMEGARTLYDEISGKVEDELKTLGEDVIEYIDNRAEFEPSSDGQEESCIIHVRDEVLKIDYEIDIHRW